MTTTTEARTPVRSSVQLSLDVGDDATIRATHFTDHPNLGCYQLHLDDTSVYLTEESAKALVSSLARAIAAAHGESTVA